MPCISPFHGLTIQAVEHLLDSGQIETKMNNGKWWRLRRNGQTKLWKTRPMEFSIPVKTGLRSCAYITNANINSGYYRVKESQQCKSTTEH